MLPLSPSLHASTPTPIAAQPPPTKPHTAVSLLRLSQTHEELSQTHALLIKTGLIHEKHAFGRLLLSLASLPRPNALDHARKLFESPRCPKNAFVYNSMIRSYSRHGDPAAALLLFLQMVQEASAHPDNFTYTFVCNACSKLLSVAEGKQVHARMVKDPSAVGNHSWNSLIDFYVKNGEDLWRVRRVFDEMRDPDVVSWNCLLDGYMKMGHLDDAEKMFCEMPQRDIISWTTMLVGYANGGLLEEACRLFGEMPERSMVSWSAMISGYVMSGQYNEALVLFKEMQAAEVEIDKITLTTLLSACARLGALDHGRWIHSYVGRHGVEVDAHLATALVDMYGKCGRIDLAYKVFLESRDQRVFLWNAMLGGLAVHSCGKEALELFSEMLDRGMKPNEISFICVLSACSHSGLVDDGLRIFYSMAKDHEVAPAIEHYGCIVDLLGRGGFLNEAKRVIDDMPFKADGNILRGLLGACRLHGNVQLGEHVGRILLELEPLDDGNYVLLSHIYANESRWEDVTRLRRVMKERGVRKTPGQSSIELDGLVHTFISGDNLHPQSGEIYSLLDSLVKQSFFSDDHPLIQ